MTETYIEKVERVIEDCVFSTDDGKKRYLWVENVDSEDKDTIKTIEYILELVNNKPELEKYEISELINMI